MLHPVSMKFILLSVVCLLGTVVAKPALTKHKRDILPGDPRYGTDYHHNHHHAHEHQTTNEVEVSQARGGYVGSYVVPETSAYQNTIKFQLPPTNYGPPNFTAGKPIGGSYHEPIPQITNFQNTVQHQQVQVPSFAQESTVSNFQTVDNVRKVNNAYLSPAVEVTQSPVSNYQPIAHQQEQHHVERVNNGYLAPVQSVVQKPVEQILQKTVDKPIDSYGTPIPAYGVLAVENHEQHQHVDDESHATSNVNTEVQVQQEVVHQEIPVHTHVEAASHTDTHVQPAVQTVQTREQVNNVYHAVQPAVHHEVQPAVHHAVQPAVHHAVQPAVHHAVQPAVHHAAQPAVHHAVQPAVHHAVQPAVHHAVQPAVYHAVQAAVHHAVQPAVHHAVQPAVHHVQPAVHHVQPAVQHQIQKTVQHSVQPVFQQQNHFQQTAQFPQTYSSGYIGTTGGNFDNFGSVGTGFETYGNPSFGSSAIPQVYSTDFSNIGLGFQQDSNSNLFQGSYSGGPVQHQETVHHFPQVQSFAPTHQFPEVQISQLPTFVPNQLPQFPSFQQETTHAVHQPAQSHSESISVVSNKQVQPTVVHIDTNSNVNSFSEQSQPIGSNGGYVY